VQFDLAQLWLSAPLLGVVLTGLVLLLLESFAGSRSRGYFMTLTLIGLFAALALEVLAWREAGEGGSRMMFSGMLCADRFSILFGILFILNAGLTVMLARPYLREHRFEFGEFYSLVLFATSGMMMMAAATDLVTVFLGLETMSIAVYVLTGSWRRAPKSSEGAVKYFLVGSFAAAILVYGIALVYGTTGFTNLQEIGRVASQASSQPLFIIGMLFVAIAFAFKIAAVPFHMWAPDAYDGAPTPVTAFMAAGVKAAAFATLLRLFGVAFHTNDLAFGASGWATIFGLLSVVTMTFGNLAALRQDNIKRMLAYSSIAHAGYLMLGVVASGFIGADARGPVLYYLVAYTFTTLGAFGVVAWIGHRGDERLDIDSWAGLGSRNPAAALAMTIFMLSLGGVPPTGGFFAKFYLFRAALEKEGLLPLVIIAVLNSVVSIYYYLRVVTTMYFREVSREPQPLRSATMTAALLVATLATLAIGILPGWAVNTATAALFGT
jgi:NADH-quinone oxidoreductase subunit N